MPQPSLFLSLSLSFSPLLSLSLSFSLFFLSVYLHTHLYILYIYIYIFLRIVLSRQCPSSSLPEPQRPTRQAQGGLARRALVSAPLERMLLGAFFKRQGSPQLASHKASLHLSSAVAVAIVAVFFWPWSVRSRGGPLRSYCSTWQWWMLQQLWLPNPPVQRRCVSSMFSMILLSLFFPDTTRGHMGLMTGQSGTEGDRSLYFLAHVLLRMILSLDPCRAHGATPSWKGRKPQQCISKSERKLAPGVR